MSLPEPNPFDSRSVLNPPTPRTDGDSRWSVRDLIVFGMFFLLTVLFLPLGVISVVRIFNPGAGPEDLSGVQQVLLQGLMDLMLVGFIFVLVRIHRRSFRETIHWIRNYQYRTGFLITLGAFLALSVLAVSAFFPPSQPPPIEKLITSTESLYVFALFGIGVAPLVEEIIFRGFLFKVFGDVGGPALAVPATAALFTLLHIPQLWGSWAGIALIFVVGYVLSVVRARSHSLIPSFIIHTAYNGMLFGVFAVGTAVQRGLPG
jgi:membrane protease YdiL (CAAX protease family)